ncbi:alpha-beta hydrolase [Pseudozyma hubeiensis SY62]|uniref:Alpha-beta hydrolase n=1 Tax=Pseudozyma hubeiensis (strain SY62) TaxID=1305764 RepID=R9P8S6_PSEHS|nr:alpha-beta hydrolase [Pseudozyma hubeiensis SY62]GAC94490.1 alpha-beta hydrolase [Pseudozyma hubeiensis SY62]
MSGFLSSTATLLGRTILSPVAPHSLFAVNVEYYKPASSSSSKTSPSSSSPTIETLLAATETLDTAKNPTFKPTPWLSTGHLQTIYSAVGNFSQIDAVEFKRRVFLTPDGGTVGLDIAPPALAPSEAELKSSSHPAADGLPTVVCLHGLTGGSHESYVRNCFSHLTKPTSQGGLGYRGIVVNFRGCANVPVTSPQLYSALKIADIRSALLFITKLYPSSPLVGIGFSLGANVLGRYLGEEGDNTPLLGGVIVGTPFDLKAGADELDYGGFLSQKYAMAMGNNLQRMARKHKDTLALHPPFRALLDDLYDAPPQPKAELELYKQQVKNGGPRDGERAIIKRGSLKAADQTMTRFVGGLPKPYGEFPFESADDYYDYGGCANNIANVQRPMLCLSAEDDPIVPSKIWDKIRAAIGRKPDGTPVEDDAEAKYNENVVLAWTKGGGHLGWFESIRPRRWLYRPTSEFIKALFDHTSDEEKARIRAKSRWAQEQIKAKEVQVELIPVEALPAYTLPGQDGRSSRWTDTEISSSKTDAKRALASGADSPARVADLERNLASGEAGAEDSLLNPSDTGFAANAPPTPAGGQVNDAEHSTLRMAWLLTHLLKEAPLVHPRHATYAPYKQPNASDADERRKLGWETVTMTMYTDKKHLEVGFAELDPNSRVAGAGETFRGGIDTPGGSMEPKRGSVQKGGKNVIAGL